MLEVQEELASCCVKCLLSDFDTGVATCRFWMRTPQSLHSVDFSEQVHDLTCNLLKALDTLCLEFHYAIWNLNYLFFLLLYGCLV
jgi:hypothetical protein